MYQSLKKLTLASWVAILLSVIALSLVALNSGSIFENQATRINSFIGLMGAVIFSIVLPILSRLYYYRKSIKSSGLTINQFLRMKRLSLILILGGIAFAVYSLSIPVFSIHLYASLAVALYGLYSLMPFEDVMRRDMNSFKVAVNDE